MSFWAVEPPWKSLCVRQAPEEILLNGLKAQKLTNLHQLDSQFDVDSDPIFYVLRCYPFDLST